MMRTETVRKIKNRKPFIQRPAALVGAGGFEPPKLKSNRFTVCPIWPLWNAPIYDLILINKQIFLQLDSNNIFAYAKIKLCDSTAGAGGRIRTPDLLITNQLLYQLSYTSLLL